jgi:thioredoxin-dependent peroxiredoxin
VPPRAGGDDWRAFDVAFFEISVDSEENNLRLADLAHLRHPILSDASRAAAAAYGVLMPGGRNARRWTFYIGADGRILYIDRDPIADGHGEGVAERLAALGFARLPALSPAR